MNIRSKLFLTLAMTLLFGMALGTAQASDDGEVKTTTKGPIPDSELLKKHQLEGYQELGADKITKLPSNAPIPDNEHFRQERREGLVDNPRSAQ